MIDLRHERITRIERLVCFGIGVGLALLIACGSSDDEARFAGVNGDAGPSSSGGSSGSISFGDGGTTGPAKGVILVHAAGFRSLRVCFENYPDILPQPDQKVMPESNSVGVDVGAAIRIPPLEGPPGAVYVIPNKKAHTPDDPNDTSCGGFLANATKNEDYLLAGRIDRPVGVNGAEAIVITGCGTQPQIDNLNIDAKDCPGYADGGAGRGTLNAVVMPLATTNTTTPSSLPVELYVVSQQLAAQMPNGADLDVTYGDLDAGPGAPLAQKVPSSAGLYRGNPTTSLDVDQQTLGTFGTHGFRIAYRLDGGSTAPDGGLFSTDQTLAEVQESSQPLATPTSYFTGATNFALLLLGDPRMMPTFADGGPNPTYDGRRAVHLLAVPVRAEEDAGTLGNAPAPDAGDAGPK